MKFVLRLFFLALLATTVLSCSRDMYSYGQYEDNLFAFLKEGQTEKDLTKLQRDYKDLIAGQRRGRKVPPPGFCADYGVCLLKKGKVEEARKQFEREMQLYPESKPLMEKMIKEITQ